LDVVSLERRHHSSVSIGVNQRRPDQRRGKQNYRHSMPHYFGWLILTNLGLNCPYSTPYEPLDKNFAHTLDNAILDLGQIANTAVELLPYGRQLTWSELWLRHISYQTLDSDLKDKDVLFELCNTYTDEIAAIGEEVTAFVSGTDAHLDFQKINLRFLQAQIESNDARIWWYRLFYPKELYIRNLYLQFIEAADDDPRRLFEVGSFCTKLTRECLHTSGRIQKTLQSNRNIISQEVHERGNLSH
jgi:hypothetical protein